MYRGNEWKYRPITYHSDSKDEDEEEGSKTNDNNSNEPLWDEVAILLLLNHTYPFSHDWKKEDLVTHSALLSRKMDGSTYNFQNQCFVMLTSSWLSSN